MTLWSKDPPKEPGWYWAYRERYEDVAPAEVGLSITQYINYPDEGVLCYPSSVTWWGPRIEPPPWPEVKEASHE